MFIMGLLLMCASVLGLVGLAFVQARYPDVLDGIMLPPEERKAKAEEKIAAEAALQSAMAPSEAEAEGEIDLGDFSVNSMPKQSPPPPQPATAAPTPPSE